MCLKRSTVVLKDSKGCFRVDECLRDKVLKLRSEGVETLGSCCGHSRYTETIIYRGDDGVIREIHTGVVIPRAKRFYVMDRVGFYYVPEVERVRTDAESGVVSRSVSDVASLFSAFQPPASCFEFFNVNVRCYLHRTRRDYPLYNFPELTLGDDPRYSVMSCLRCAEHCLLPVSNIPLSDWGWNRGDG